MGNPVVHFEVIGKDVKALQSFYGQAFDWEIDPMPDGTGMEYAMVRPQGEGGGEGGINGGIGAGPDAGYGGHVTFYVAVPKLEDALAKIERLGGKTMMPPDQVPNGPRIALFTDPEGHVVGLVQMDDSAG